MGRLIFILVLTFSSVAFGQTNTDSLRQIWKDSAQMDSIRLNALNISIEYWMYTNIDSAEKYARKQYDLAIALEAPAWKATALRLMGRADYMHGNYEKAMIRYNESKEVSKQNNDKRGLANTYNHIAGTYGQRGDYAQASSMFQKALAISKEIKDSSNLAYILNNLGYTSHLQENYKEAIAYYEESFLYNKPIGDKRSYAHSLNNLATTYARMGLIEEAQTNFKKSLKLLEGIGDARGVANTYGELGILKMELKELDSALFYVLAGLESSKSIGFKEGVAIASGFVGRVYYEIGDYQKALTYCKSGKQVATEIGLQLEIQNISYTMYLCYSALKQYKPALEMLELNGQLADSLKKEEIRIRLMRSSFQYEYEKKKLADSISFEKQREIERLKIAEQEAQLESERWERYALYGGLLLVGAFSFLLYRGKKRSELDGATIEYQKEQVESQRDEIQRINDQLEEQNEEIIAFNHSLEKIVQSRTIALESSLEKLQQYQWELSHKVRAPLATLIGLLNLIQDDRFKDNDNVKVLGMLQENAQNMDVLLKEIAEILEEE